MRSIVGVLSLLIVLAIVGVLMKKNLSSTNQVKLPSVAEETMLLNNPVDTNAKPNANAQQQAQQIQQQVKAATEAALQQPRAMPEDK